MALQIGTRIGPYEIVGAIGAGGMGEVYKARDIRLGRTVAIKVLLQTGADTADRILREARAAARLNHPNIAALHDVVDYPLGDPAILQHFLVMEYVDGTALSKMVAAGPLDTARALDIAIQLADALIYAHRQGIIHRDIKPANVLLTRDNHVKLLDLGLAIAQGSDSDALTRTDPNLPVAPPLHGTPAYMAPEQLAGATANVQTDVYSMGVLLYELLTGRRPFDAPDRVALAMRMVSGDTPRVSARCPSVPPTLDHIVARAMAKAPADRPQSVSALRDELIRVRDESRTVAPASDPRRSSMRSAGRLAISALALAVIVLGSWTAIARWRASGAPARIAILPAINASEDPELDALGATLVSILTDNVASTAGVKIASANPSAYRAPQRDLTTAARELGQGYLVDLRLRRAGTGASVDGQLLDTTKGSPLWHDQFDGGSLDVVRHVTERLSTSITPRALLRAGLTEDDREKLRRMPTTSADAFAAYLRGRVPLDASTRDRATLQRAVASFEDAVKGDSHFALAYAGLAQAWATLSSFGTSAEKAEAASRAADAAKRALDLDPGSATVQAAVAKTDQLSNHLEDAVRHAREAVRIAPDDDSHHRGLAAVLAARHDLPGAIGEARVAVALRPTYFSNQYTLGFYCYSAGRYQEAIPPLVRATELQADSAANFTMLGAAYHKAGDVQQAIGNYAQAVRLGGDAGAYSNLGTAYYAAGQFIEASSNYQKAIALIPSSSKYHRNLADTYERLSRTDDARREYTAAIARADADLKASPSTPPATMAQKAFCEAKLGRLNDAAEDIAAALTLSHRTDNDIMFKSAVVEALAGHVERALHDLEDALRLGYPLTFARDDWDLRTLRDLPKFRELVNRKAQ